jgi:hypothetical protein
MKLPVATESAVAKRLYPTSFHRPAGMLDGTLGGALDAVGDRRVAALLAIGTSAGESSRPPGMARQVAN